MNDRVAKGVASDPHDFTAAQSKRLGEYVQGLTPLSRFSVLQSQ
jgi:hypothetical protein